jgi:hypothetical protein
MTMSGPAAFRRGFAIAASQWLWLVGLCAARTVGLWLELFAWLFSFTWLLKRNSGIALAAIVFVASLWVEVVRWLILGSAVHETANGRGLGQGILAISGRSLIGLLCLWIIHFIAKILIWTALASSAAAYLVAWEHPALGALPASATLAAVLTWLLPVALFSRVWTELAFVESVKRDQGYLTSLAVAAGKFVQRFWGVFGIYVVTTVIAWTSQGIITAIANGIATGGRGFLDIPFLGVSQITAALLIAIVGAFLELARFQGFAALETYADNVALGLNSVVSPEH